MPSINERTKQSIKTYKSLEELNLYEERIKWQQAEIWSNLKKTGDYKYVFGADIHQDNEKSWKTFVAETKTPLPTVVFKIRLYRKWVEELGYDFNELLGASHRALSAAIPHVTSKERADELLRYAKELSLTDFMKYLNGNQEPCWHQHKEKKTEEVTICKDCHKKLTHGE